MDTDIEEELELPDGFQLEEFESEEASTEPDAYQVLEAGLVTVLEAVGDLAVVLERIVGKLGELELKIDAIAEDG